MRTAACLVSLRTPNGGRSWGNVPEIAFCPDAQILQHEPDAVFFLRIGQPERTRRQASNKISSEHSLRLTATDGEPLRHAELRLINARGLESGGLGCQLRHALDVGTKFVGIILVRGSVATAIGSYITSSYSVRSAWHNEKTKVLGGAAYQSKVTVA